MVTKPPNRNLSDQATPWGRWVEDNIQGLQNSEDQQAQGLQNAFKGINGSIQALTSQTVTVVRSARLTDSQVGNGFFTGYIALPSPPSWSADPVVSATLTIQPNSESGGGGGGTIYGSGNVIIQYYDPIFGGWISDIQWFIDDVESDPSAARAQTIVASCTVPRGATGIRAQYIWSFAGGTIGGGVVSGLVTAYYNR